MKKSFISTEPERQGEKPLRPVLKTLVCRGRDSKPRPPAQEADAQTTRTHRRLNKRKKIRTEKKNSQTSQQANYQHGKSVVTVC